LTAKGVLPADNRRPTAERRRLAGVVGCEPADRNGIAHRFMQVAELAQI
jgi:hypothetical protein